MIINKDRLIVQGLLGKISHPRMPMEGGLLGGYMFTWDGKPKIGLGIGGIKYNVKVGDSCFGWPEAEHLEPGVALMGIDEKTNARGRSSAMALSARGTCL